jgi:hypothetical protein
MLHLATVCRHFSGPEGRILSIEARRLSAEIKGVRSKSAIVEHKPSHRQCFDEPLVLVISLELAIFPPVTVNILLPGANSGVVSSGNEQVAYRNY